MTTDLIKTDQYAVDKCYQHHLLKFLHGCIFINLLHNKMHGKFGYVPEIS